MKKILYNHGFMSSANSSTVNVPERFGNEFEIITPERGHDSDIVKQTPSN